MIRKVCLLLSASFAAIALSACSVQSAKFSYQPTEEAAQSWQQVQENKFSYEDVSIVVVVNDMFQTTSHKTTKRSHGNTQRSTALELTLSFYSKENSYEFHAQSATLHYQGETFEANSYYYGKMQNGACIGLFGKHVINITPSKRACVVYKYMTDRIPPHSELTFKAGMSSPTQPEEAQFVPAFEIDIKS